MVKPYLVLLKEQNVPVLEQKKEFKFTHEIYCFPRAKKFSERKNDQTSTRKNSMCVRAELQRTIQPTNLIFHVSGRSFYETRVKLQKEG